MKMGWISAGLVAAALGVAPTITLHIEKPVFEASTHAAPGMTDAAAMKGKEPARRAAGKVRAVGAEKVPALLRMPLDFEANQGQAPAGFAFVAHGPAYALGVSPTGLDLALHRPVARTGAEGFHEGDTGGGTGGFLPVREESSRLQLQLRGAAQDARVSGLDPQSGRSNYFIGNDRSKWRTSVPHFNRVKIAAPYRGIDLVLYGSHEQLEYDFDVAPAADPAQIRLGTRGAERVELDAEGNALLETAVGAVKLHRPESYQMIDGARRTVPSRFVLAGHRELQFAVGAYDRSRALVIDPVLDFAVGFGGSNGNQGMGLEVDATGNLYVTGNSCSADFPTTSGSFSDIHTNPAAKDCQDLFVTKLDPTASTLLFSDFIGGSSASSTGTYLALDASDDVFVTGATGASDFPTVSNIGPSAPAPCGISTKGYNCPDGFILKLSPDGSQILFSSLLGGNQASGAYQVGLNPVTGDLTVLGATNSSSFLPAPTTLETTFSGGSCNNSNPCFNTFLVGLDPATGALRYEAYIGGPNNDWSSGLAFDTSGNVYVAGSTQLPLSSSLGSVTHTYAPGGGATASGTSLFVTKLNLSANHLTPGYLTVVEADADTGPSSLAVDSTGNAYFGGATAAAHLPVTTGVFQTTNKSTYGDSCLWGPIMTPFLPSACGTGLVGKLDPTGALSFLTYVGGSGQDEVESIALDSSDNVWLTGVTSSQDFPVTADSYSIMPGLYVPFLAEMTSNGSGLTFASLIAGNSGQSTSVEIDGSNNIYVAGFAGSVPATPGTYPLNPNVFNPSFVEKWSTGTAPTISLSATSLNFPQTALGASSTPQTVTVQNTSTVPMEISVAFSSNDFGYTPGDFPESTTCAGTLAGGASCTITASFAPGPPSPICVALQGCDISNRIESLVIANNSIQGAQTVGLNGLSGVGPAFSFATNPIVFPAQAAGTASPALFVQAESTGDAALIISNMVLSGPNASDFQLATPSGVNDCSVNPTSPGSLCNLNITFSPPANATGTRTATLTFTDNAGDSPQSIPVMGTVATANFLNISPVLLQTEFPVAIGASTSLVLDLQNPSTTNSVQVTGLGITGKNAGDFSVHSVSCGTSGALPGTIAPGATCIVDLAVAPAAGASGLRTATLMVTTNPAATGLPTVTLQADAVTNAQPGMGVSEVPNPLNFGGLQVGETSNAASVILSISNYAPIPCAGGAGSCGAPLVINSITPGLSDYSIAPGAPGCTTFPVTIPSGGYPCTFDLVFKPTAAGSRNTVLTITSNDPQGTVTVPIYGSGLSLPLGEALQSALDFGKSAIGVASPPMTTTLLNAGQSPLTVSNVTATANFAVSANTCTAPVAPQATCTISVTFTPPSAGYFTGTLTITDNDALGAQQVVTMAGTGATGPQLRITPPTLNFGNQAVNTPSTAQTLTLTSTGDTTVTFPTNALRISTDFILGTTTCGSSLAEGASCTASVQFKPSVVTVIPESGTLLITDNVVGSPQPVYMQGTGVQATGAATTTSVTSSANPAATGANVTFTATVAGPSGTPTGTVTFLDGTTTLGTGTLNASAQATYSTSTLAAGSHSITAAYGGDATFAASTSSVLTETVGTPGFTVGASPSTITVSAGSSGTTKITVTPSGGFSQAVSFACSGLPAASTCSFAPATVTPTGGAAASTTVTVATNVAAASLSRPASPRRCGAQAGTMLALLLLGLGGVVRLRRRALGMLFVLTFVALGLAVSGCGGGNGGGGGGGGGSTTPAGTSTVTVTATAGSLTQTTTFTLTVQ